MFMKRAEDLTPPKNVKPIDPNKPHKPSDQLVHPGEVVKGTKTAPMDKAPNPVANSMLGIPKKATSMEDAVGTAKNITEKGVKRLGQTGAALMRGTKETLEKAPEKIDDALKYVENLSPAAQAALVGGAGYVGAKKIGKGIARVAGGTAKASTMQRLLKGLRRMRGR